MVVIIGAGPAGLATAARLQRSQQPYTLLEQSDAVGSSWRNHYERLHLHTVKEYSHLPFRPFPENYPRYPSRQQVVDYLDDYTAHFGIEPHFGQNVRRVAKHNGTWAVITGAGDTYEAAHVVVATGFNRVPYEPTWPGMDAFGGSIMHSRRYRNAAPYRGQRVLVIGMGNTGAEIALDLCEQGAAAAISIRGPVNIVPRDVLGRPTQVTGILLNRLPAALADRIALLFRRLTVGDLARYGIRTPEMPPLAQLRETAKTPVVDMGTLARIKAGEIEVLPEVERFAVGGVRLIGGREMLFDAVILATGYRPRLKALIDAPAPFLDGRGYPVAAVGSGDNAGLHFVGFDGYLPGGLLYSISRDSARVCAAIAEGEGGV